MMEPDNYISIAEFDEVKALLDILNGYTFDEIGYDVQLHDKNGDSLGVITTRNGELAWTPGGDPQ